MSDSEGEGDGVVFDPSAVDRMTDKERKKWEKSLRNWRHFMDFLVRHLAITTFRYNIFEEEQLQQFMMALEKAEHARSLKKLKKGEEARISCFKVMKDAAELLLKQDMEADALRIRKFLDIAGRLRGLATIGMGFFKALKKGKVGNVDKLKHYADYWKGFTTRSFDYSELTFKGTDPERFNALERKYLVWPTVLRTSINLAQKFLKLACDVTGLEMMNPDPKVQNQHMQAAEFVVATRIEEMLLSKIATESQSFVLGSSTLQNKNGRPVASLHPTWQLPLIEDIDMNLIKPIPDTGMLLNLPSEVPKEKKKGRKGKGKKGRGKSAGKSKKKKKK